MSHNDGTSYSYTLPKKDLKYIYNHMMHPMISADITIFSHEVSNFCCMWGYRKEINFETIFLILLTFILKIVLINTNALLIVST